MSGNHYSQGYGGGIPPYPLADETTRQRQYIHPQSRNPRPGLSHPDRPLAPIAMDRASLSFSQLRSPRQVPTLRAGQQVHRLPEYVEDTGFNFEQLNQPPARPTRDGSISPRSPPRRPARPDDSPLQVDHRQHGGERPRHLPQMAPPGWQPHRAPPSPQHGSHQWLEETHGRLTPPPDYPLPSRPLPPIAAIPRQSPTAMAVTPRQAHQQAAYQHQENRRPPLGPPPSARRGPSSYYPQVGPVHPIVEESDSMRGSTRTGSGNTGGHDSKTSFASSNAIPIGISQTHLEWGREGVIPPVRRPSPPSDTKDDAHGDSPTEPAIARGEIRTPDYTHTRDQASPEQPIVRQASLGKRSKPTLTTVKSSDQARKSVGEDKSALSSLSSHRQNDIRDAAIEDIARSVRARALAQEMLEWQDPPRASSAQDDQLALSHRQCPSIASAETATAVGLPGDLSQQETNQSDDSFMTNPYEGMAAQTGTQRPEAPLDPGVDLMRRSSASTDNTEQRRQRLSLEAMLHKELGLPSPEWFEVPTPHAPVDDPTDESLVGSLEKGGALSAEEAQALQQPMGGLSDRAGKPRPPRLDVGAVKDAEARGSLTSLTDLVRRATRLASNLDRGKTASKLGVEWMEDDGADEQQRHSGHMSDILAAFPPPAPATPPGSRGTLRRSIAARSRRGSRHSALASDSDAGAIKPGRRCGIPLWGLICILVVLFLMVAAAIIFPVVFVVIPGQGTVGSTKVGTCAAELSCNNGGTNILGSNGACECLCVNGYTDSTCATYQHSGCTTIDAGNNNDNATVGHSVPRLLNAAASNFSIPLNTQELLGLFSTSDMSCNVQNQLVTFNGKSMKRCLIPISAKLRTTTSDGIVYATTTPDAASTEDTTLDFARVTVLWLFQTTQDLQAAVDAQERLQAYFRLGDITNGRSATASNLTLGHGYIANLSDLRVITKNGTALGGKEE